MTKNRFVLTPALRSLLAMTLLLGVVSGAPQTEASQQSLREAENRRYKAMVNNDLEALAAIFDDDLVYTHTNGQVDDKETFLATLESGALRYRRIQIQEMSPVSWAGEAGVVTGKLVLEVQAGDRQVSVPIRYTAVYRLGDDRAWHLLAWQSTAIPAAAPTHAKAEATPAAEPEEDAADPEIDG